MTEPIACPFCEGTLLQENEPTEIQFDEEIWTIRHWQCLECGETFDKVMIHDEDGFDEELYDMENGLDN